MRKVLIFGAAGFVASHAANLFVEIGWDVTLVDVHPPGSRSVLNPYLRDRIIICDIRSQEEVQSLSAYGPWDGMVNCAGIVGPIAASTNVANAIAVNVIGTQHILELATATDSKLTYLSTATLYGDRDDVKALTEDLEPRPIGNYDMTKLMGEMVIGLAQRNHNLSCVILRPSFVYGPGSAIGEYFLPSVLRGIEINKGTGCDHPCEFTYVKDLANAIVQSQTSEVSEGIFNISSGQYKTLGDLAEVIRTSVPDAQINLGPGVDRDRHWRVPMSLTKSLTEMSYAPAWSLQEGVEDWLKFEGRWAASKS